jgi:hypothetical protein
MPCKKKMKRILKIVASIFIFATVVVIALNLFISAFLLNNPQINPSSDNEKGPKKIIYVIKYFHAKSSQKSVEASLNEFSIPDKITFLYRHKILGNNRNYNPVHYPNSTNLPVWHCSLII